MTAVWPFDMPVPFSLTDINDGSQPIINLWPVNHDYVTLIFALDKVFPINDPTEQPQES